MDLAILTYHSRRLEISEWGFSDIMRLEGVLLTSFIVERLVTSYNGVGDVIGGSW